MKFTKSILSLSVVLALSACGGSSDSGDGGGGSQPPPANVVETVISGKAVKGTLANAVVTVYKYVNGEKIALTDEELAEANIMTQEDGSYTFTLLDYNGPVKIELSASTDSANPTTMICDASAGCGDIAFGEVIDITAADPTFTLSAISMVDSNSNGQVKVNVSSLTHLASALIEADSSGINTESVQKQSSRIANTFGIQGSITELEPTSVNSTSDVANEDNANELRYGLINAGIASAIFSGESNTTDVLSNKFNDIITDLVENDGALLINQDEDDGFELSIADVFNGAIAASDKVVTLIKADANLSGTDEKLAELAQLETNLENKKIAEEALSGENGRSQVVTEIITDGSAVQKASAMLEDMRLLANLFDVTHSSNQEVSTEGEAYVALIDDANVMIEAEGASFLLLAEVSEAIAGLSLQHDNGELSGTVFPINSYLSAENANGTITFDEDNLVFGVDAVSGGETVKLNIAIVFADDGLSLSLNIDGTIESAGASLTIAQGSSAKINVDYAISKANLEDDSFDGSITSGELKLDVAIAQKASDIVVNPVMFKGLINAKLVPIDTTKLEFSEPSYYNDPDYHGPYDGYFYKPQDEVTIVPEMLSLTGSFSSQSGNLIKATLTVNVTNLDGYQAPELEYIGAPIASLRAYTVSEDLNRVVVTPSTQVLSSYKHEYNYVPGNKIGEWSVTSKFEGESSTNINYYVSRPVDYGLDKPGYDFSQVWVSYAERHENGYKVNPSMHRFVPIDYDNDLITDTYQVFTINEQNFSADFTFDPEQPLTTSGDFLAENGAVLNFDNVTEGERWFHGFFRSIEDFARVQPWAITADPANIASAVDMLISYDKAWADFDSQYELDAKEVTTEQGIARYDFDFSDLEPLKQGHSVLIDGFISQPLLKDAVTVTVNSDASAVTSNILDAITTTYTLSAQSAGNFTANIKREFFENAVDHDAGYIYNEKMWSKTYDIGLDQEEIIFSRSVDEWGWYYQVKISPVDNNGDNKTDFYEVYYMDGYGFNTNGELTFDNGEILTFDQYGSNMGSFDSYDSVNWGDSSFYWALNFNPKANLNAISLFASFGSEQYEYVDDIGKVEVSISQKDLSLITTNTSNIFDVINSRPDKESALLENKDTFLQGNAALSLETVLGDYQVNIQLSGEKTALEDGDFELSLAYKLPDDSAQRSFEVKSNTQTADTLIITNVDGVTLTLTKLPEDNPTNEVVLGTIMVGEGAEAGQAAKIVDRNELILVVYSDGSVESL